MLKCKILKTSQCYATLASVGSGVESKDYIVFFVSALVEASIPSEDNAL